MSLMQIVIPDLYSSETSTNRLEIKIWGELFVFPIVWKGLVIKCIRSDISFLLDQLNEVTIRLSKFSVRYYRKRNNNGNIREKESNMSVYERPSKFLITCVIANMAAEHDRQLRCSLYLRGEILKIWILSAMKKIYILNLLWYNVDKCKKKKKKF